MNNLNDVVLTDRFKIETGETDNKLVSSFLNGAKNTILAKTNRKSIPEELLEMQFQLALSRYNKRGNEGLSSYSEGGESESYLTEDDILSGIENYRLSAVARRIQDEKEKSEEVQS